jgi:hypothetical protein
LQTYLQKSALYPAQVSAEPASDLGLIITIPCRDEPNVEATFLSLKDCELPECSTEVILLINDSNIDTEEVKEQNQKTLEYAQGFAKKYNTPRLKFFPLYFTDMTKKKSGVGIARKIAMDEGLRRLTAVENRSGVITGLDADSLVDKNYLTAVFDYFSKDEKCQAASIHYEHPLEGNDFPAENYAAILTYELHLRYYVHALRAAGLPTAFQTVGSSMAVRGNAYAKQGGMPRKKAGEDFYFIHKFTGLGGFREITGTTVIPSPRISTRVPFGTGKAIGDILEGKPFLTHAPASFVDLKVFLSQVEVLYSEGFEKVKKDLSSAVLSFLEEEEFSDKLNEIKANTNSKDAFIKRFFVWFDAFRAMKYVHFVRDNFYADMSVENAVREWMIVGKIESEEVAKKMSEKDFLLFFRHLDLS